MKFMIAGSCATEGYQPRQVRKEAAAVTASVCRTGAWLSPLKAAERIEHGAKSGEEIYARRSALCRKVNMSYLVLARKWRPQTFEEVGGERAGSQGVEDAPP